MTFVVFCSTEKPVNTIVIIAAAVFVLALAVIVAVGLFIYKQKNGETSNTN